MIGLSVDRTPAVIEINNFAAGLNDIGPRLIASVDHARPVALTARLTSDRFKTKLLICRDDEVLTMDRACFVVLSVFSSRSSA